MAALVYIGTVLALMGVLGLGLCVARARAAKRAGLEGEAMEAALKKLIALNLGSVLLAALGLMMVIVGVILG